MNAFGNPTTYLILLGLAVGAAGYAWGCVRPLRRRDPLHGQTALLVVIGDGLVALAAVLVVAASGPVDALGLAAILVACLVAGGLPMIVEYVDDHTSQRQARRRGEANRELAHLVGGDDDAV